MDDFKKFKKDYEELTEHIKENLKYVTNEEETKMSLINPFIDLLGYNTRTLSKIRYEYIVDEDKNKKNKNIRKVDYAILDNNNQTFIYIEDRHNIKRGLF